MEFKSLKDLNKYLNSKIDEVLGNEVATEVKEEISQSVSDIVYGAGEPVMYARRGIYPNSLGLGDIMKMHHTVNNGTLKVTDAADLDRYYSRSEADYSKSLAENIEYGYGSKSTWYNEPRPFMKDAKDKLASNKNHIKAMKIGLKKRGIKVEE